MLPSASHVDDDVRCTCVVVCCQCVLSADCDSTRRKNLHSCIVYHCMPEKLYMYFYFSYLLCAVRSLSFTSQPSLYDAFFDLALDMWMPDAEPPE